MNEKVAGTITLRELINRGELFLAYLLGRWKTIIMGTVLFTLLFLGYNLIKSPTYTARTTFVLENQSGGGLGQLSSLASLAGVNVGGLSESGRLFQIDNIQELYRSRRMIEKTLLSTSTHADHRLLINHYATSEKLIEKWKNKFSADDLDFLKPREEFSRLQDSLLMEVTNNIQEANLIVSKPSRKLSILDVSVIHKDEVFAKEFDQVLVRNVNEFYIETRTKKARENLRILQSQTDSVKRVLDSKVYEYAAATQELPNANPLYATNQVPIQKLSIDLQTSGAVYAEMVKNLEVSKVTLRNTTPLIQIIDEPILPLEDGNWSLLKTIVLGIIIGGILMVSYLSLSYFYHQAMLVDKQRVS